MKFKDFAKVYTLPILLLFVTFGMYYSIFYAGEHYLLKRDITHITKTENVQIAANVIIPKTDKLVVPQNEIQELEVPKEMLTPAKNEIPIKKETPKYMMVQAQALNVRESMDANSKIIAKLYRGAIVEVEPIEGNGNYIKLLDGYILSRFLANVETSTTASGDEICVKISAKALNVRESMDANSKIIAKLYRGAIVKINEFDPNSTYTRLLNGYVLSKFLVRCIQ